MEKLLEQLQQAGVNPSAIESIRAIGEPAREWALYLLATLDDRHEYVD